eukprot:jgi/Bigna1/68985/fgenesh1_pg.7_\
MHRVVAAPFRFRPLRRLLNPPLTRLFSSEEKANTQVSSSSRGPLDGIRVLELGQLIAGPWAGTVLAYFGADVVKVEPPRGDPIRGWRQLDETGTSFWWRGHARNKRSICVDLKSDQGREVIKELAGVSDVLIENFKPGKMEEWGLGPQDLEKLNEELIYTRISGYGQTGPYSKLPGFASVCEAVGGFRYVNGFPDRPSVRPNLSMGDTMAALQAVIGILLALQARNGNQNARWRKEEDAAAAASSSSSSSSLSSSSSPSCGKGQVVDVAIYESVFNLLEGVVSEFDGAGVVRGCSGSTLTGIVPSNLYRPIRRGSDGKDIIIGANGDSLYSRLLDTMEVEKESCLRSYDSNAKRVEKQGEIDIAIGKWVKQRPTDATLEILSKASIPSGLIYNVEDMMNDPHYIARNQFEQVEIGELDRKLKIPAISPVLSRNPGTTRHPGRSKPGEDTVDILEDWLRKDTRSIDALLEAGSVMKR